MLCYIKKEEKRDAINLMFNASRFNFINVMNILKRNLKEIMYLV